MKVSIENLEKSGYRKYIDSMKSAQGQELLSNHPYKGSWQKRIADDKGIKYFINIDLYDFGDSDFKNRIPVAPKNFSAHSQFEIEEEDFHVNFELLDIKDKTIEFVENLFEKQWKAHNSIYSEKF